MKILPLGLLICVVLCTLAATSHAQPSSWPTLHRDNQRSGHTAEVIGGPYERKWFRDFHDEMIASRVEAIVAEGFVFVGTFAGKVYALKVEDGSEAWTVQLPGAVGHSPAYHDGHLFVGSEGGSFNRGYVTCLRAVDGKEVWKHRTPAGVWVAPACDGKTVYAGDRAGVFHAIDATNGMPRWQLQTGDRILTPASLTADGQKIVFASEDMHVYCVDPTGKLLWKSPKCGGLSLRDHAPTIWKNLAIVRTNPVARFHQALGMSGMKVLGETQKKIPLGPDDFVIQDKWGTYALRYTEKRMAAERKAVADYLRDHPEERTFWAFNLNDGKEPWLAPIPYTCGLHNPGAPPTFDPETGELYLWSASALSNYSAGVPGGAAVLATLDRATGEARTIWHKNLRNGKEALGWASQFCAPADETQTLSLMGNIVLNAHQGIIGGLDLKSLRWHTVWSARDSYAGIFGPAYVGSYSPAGQKQRVDFVRQGFLLDVPNEWHGPDRAVVAIAQRRFFWIAGSQVVCLGGPDTPKTATGGGKNPPPIKRIPPGRAGGGNLVVSIDAPPAVTAEMKPLTEDSIKPLLDSTRKPVKHSASALASEVRARLDATLLELIDGGPWAPLILQLGITGEERHFWRSAEVMQTVALALPHLSPAVQPKAKAFLDELFRSGAPLTNAVERPDGKRREAYDLGSGNTQKFAAATPKYQAGIDDLYALWAYAEFADRWDKVLPQVDRIEQLFASASPFAFNPDGKEGADAERLNSRIAGTLAYVRIMRKAGKSAEAGRGMARLSEWAAERVHHERVDPRLVRPTRLLHGANVPRYVGLVPELAALVNIHAGAELSRNVRELMRDLPVWHQAYGERLIGGENYISPPNLARGLFAALADGADAAPEELARFLDQPWCKADLYYIEKCAALLRALDGAR